MSTGTLTEKKTSVAAKQTDQLPSIGGPRLPFHPAIEERFGIDRASWKALVEAIFPNATSVESVILALSYCRARNLDPFKRNVHIVPIYDRNRGGMVDTVWPGIGELRTTAFRTGQYAGRGETIFGDDVSMKLGTADVTFPEWAQVVVFRLVQGQRVEFWGPRVYWLETYATRRRDDDTPNDMWMTRPRGQIDKCAEAAALRAAFPEEIGGECIPDEVRGMPSMGVEGGGGKVQPSKLNSLLGTGPIETTTSDALDGPPAEAPIVTAEESSELAAAKEPENDYLAGLADELDACETVEQVGAVEGKFKRPELTLGQIQFLQDACAKRRKSIEKEAKKK